MSDGFHFDSTGDRWREILKAAALDGGKLRIVCLLREMQSNHADCSTVDLPASDARRLRDWLNERYPDEEKG